MIHATKPLNPNKMENEIKEHFEKKGNQPINTIEIKWGKYETMQFTGLTKREYFAGFAMQGIMASYTELAANGESTLSFWRHG